MPANSSVSVPSNRRARRHPDEAPPARRWATPTEAADYARVSKRTVRQLAADGKITRYVVGSRITRYDLNELDKLLAPVDGGAE